jgi:hypothetical protein
MARLRLLHSIHRQRTNRINGDLVDVACRVVRAGGNGRLLIHLDFLKVQVANNAAEFDCGDAA